VFFYFQNITNNKEDIMARISQETIEEVRAVPILDLAIALGDNPKRTGKQYQVFCPNPNHSENTPDTYIEPNKNIFNCFGGGGCGAKGNDSLRYYGWHEHGEYENKLFVKCVKGVAETMGITIKYDDGSVEGSKKPKKKYKPREIFNETPAQSDKVVDQVYRAFLSLCPIKENHARELLMERKYQKDEVMSIQLRSVPTMQEWIPILRTLRNKKYPLEFVPGFSQRFIPDGYETPFPVELMQRDDERKGYWVFVPSASAGYFIPVRNEFGHIVRLRVRRDTGSPKYIWFSSYDNSRTEENILKVRRKGASSGAPVNVVPPVSLIPNWEVGTDLCDYFKTDVVIATEGEHKSYISAKLLKLVLLGAPGVGNFKEILPIIQRWEVKKFIIAYDMDALNRKDDSEKEVKKQKTIFEKLKEFALEVHKLGIDVYLWTWNISDAKGLDDLLLATKTPVEVNLRTGDKKLVNLKELHNVA
jgi:hypothetical protein